MFPTCKSQRRVKNQKSTDKHSSFDGLIQENLDLSDIYLVVLLWPHIRALTYNSTSTNINKVTEARDSKEKLNSDVIL
jgi:hypothetical protein